jgi:hypothetical protein
MGRIVEGGEEKVRTLSQHTHTPHTSLSSYQRFKPLNPKDSTSSIRCFSGKSNITMRMPGPQGMMMPDRSPHISRFRHGQTYHPLPPSQSG